jgi:hypothetical protein
MAAISEIASLELNRLVASREAIAVSFPERGGRAAPLSRDPKLRKQPHAK